MGKEGQPKTSVQNALEKKTPPQKASMRARAGATFKRMAIPAALSIGLALGGANLSSAQAQASAQAKGKIEYVRSDEAKKAIENFLNPKVKISKRDAQLVLDDMFARLKSMFPQQYADYVSYQASRGYPEKPSIIMVGRLSDTYPEKTEPSPDDALCASDAESRPIRIYVPRRMENQDEANLRLHSLGQAVSLMFCSHRISSNSGFVGNYVAMSLIADYFKDGIFGQPVGNEFRSPQKHNTPRQLVLPSSHSELDESSFYLELLAMYLCGNGKIDSTSVHAYVASELAGGKENRALIERVLGSNFFKAQRSFHDGDYKAAASTLKILSSKGQFDLRKFDREKMKAKKELLLYLLGWDS